MIITTRDDLRIWIDNVRPDVVEHDLRDELVDAIQREDHPAWGSDWEQWLDAEVPRLVDDVRLVTDAASDMPTAGNR